MKVWIPWETLLSRRKTEGSKLQRPIRIRKTQKFTKKSSLIMFQSVAQLIWIKKFVPIMMTIWVTGFILEIIIDIKTFSP